MSQHRAPLTEDVFQIRQGYTKSLSIQISQPDPNRLLPIARVCAVRIGEIVLVDASEAQMVR